jgi:hypothetical protein
LKKVGVQVHLPKAHMNHPSSPLASSSSSVMTCGLPKWFTSTLSSSGAINLKISKTSNKTTMLPEWAQRHLVELVHVKPCYCAQSMSKGELRLHNSNGTYVGVIQNPKGDQSEEDVWLLLSCPGTSHKIKENKLPDVIKIVKKQFRSFSGDSEISEHEIETVKETNSGQLESDGVLWILLDGDEALQNIIKRLSKGIIMINPDYRLFKC